MKRTFALAGAIALFSSVALANSRNDDVAENWPPHEPVFGSMQFNNQPENVGVGLENIGTQDSAMGVKVQGEQRKDEDVLTALVEQEHQMAGRRAREECKCPE